MGPKDSYDIIHLVDCTQEQMEAFGVEGHMYCIKDEDKKKL